MHGDDAHGRGDHQRRRARDRRKGTRADGLRGTSDSHGYRETGGGSATTQMVTGEGDHGESRRRLDTVFDHYDELRR